MDHHPALLKPLKIMDGSIVLPHPMTYVSPVIEIDDQKFIKKNEFHITIFSTKRYAPVLVKKDKISEKDAKNKILKAISDFTKDHPLKFSRYLEDFRFATEDDKKTIVVRGRSIRRSVYFFETKVGYFYTCPSNSYYSLYFGK